MVIELLILLTILVIALIYGVGVLVLAAAVTALTILVLGWRVAGRYRADSHIVAGTVVVEDQTLPSFRVEATQGGKQLVSRSCSRGVFVLHDLPAGSVDLKWTWGDDDYCWYKARVRIRRPVQYVDVEIPLTTSAEVSSEALRTNVALTFSEPAVSGKGVLGLGARVRFHCKVTVKESSNPEQHFDIQVIDCSGKEWKAVYPLDGVGPSVQDRKYSVTTWVDGAGKIQKKARVE